MERTLQFRNIGKKVGNFRNWHCFFFKLTFFKSFQILMWATRTSFAIFRRDTNRHCKYPMPMESRIYFHISRHFNSSMCLDTLFKPTPSTWRKKSKKCRLGWESYSNWREHYIKLCWQYGAKYLCFFSSRSLKMREKYTNWHNLVCLSLYIFWGKCVYFSIFEW